MNIKKPTQKTIPVQRGENESIILTSPVNLPGIKTTGILNKKTNRVQRGENESIINYSSPVFSPRHL